MAFVLLPCDLPTWRTICRHLGSMKSLKSASEFTDAFHDLHEFCNVGINVGSFESSPREKFAGLEMFLEEDTELDFFSLTLPAMIDFALSINTNRPPEGVQYSLQKEGRFFSLPRAFAASLLAHVFFCTLPRRTRNSHPSLTDPCLAPLLSSLNRETQRLKLKVFLNYFRLLALYEPTGHITYIRKVMSTESSLSSSKWISSQEPLCPFFPRAEGRLPSAAHEGALLACFASRSLATPTFHGQNCQEAETMLTFPELLLTSVLCEHLTSGEVYQVCGALRVACIRDLKTRPSGVLLDSFEIPDVIHTLMAAPDHSEVCIAQYEATAVVHELNTSLLAFTPTPYPQGLQDDHKGSASSSSEFVSVSRQHSDLGDSGVQRDKNYSSDENVEASDDKNKRIKNFCLRGMNQQSRKTSKLNRTASLNEANSYDELEDITLKNPQDDSLENSQELLQIEPPIRLRRTISSTAEGKRDKFVDSRKIKSSISSEGIKSLNRNIHRKRKRKKKKSLPSNSNLELEAKNKQLIKESYRNEVESYANTQNNKNDDFASSQQKMMNAKNSNLNEKDIKTIRQERFKMSSDASTKDSDYLTADINDDTQEFQGKEDRTSVTDNDTKFLMDRVAKAIENIELENRERRLNKENMKKDGKTGNKKNHNEIKQIKVDENKGKSLLNISEEKLTQKPPLPKRPLRKSLPTPPSGRFCGDARVPPVRSNTQDTNFGSTEEDIYFSAFESLESQDGASSKWVSNPAKRSESRRAREGKETRRKSSFAQRLKETLSRGLSGDSDDLTGVEAREKKDGNEGGQSNAEGRHVEEVTRSGSRQMVVRKISEDLSFDDCESLEPISARFQVDSPSQCCEGSNLSSSASEEGTSDDGSSFDDSNSSVSSRYSFSSDYSSDLNEMYGAVEEILQPLSNHTIGPRRLAVHRFSRFILKRSLSESYKGSVFSLGGQSCPATSREAWRSMDTLSEPSGSEVKLKTSRKRKPKNKQVWQTVVTGNWGCGRLKGDPQFKAMLQWAAASQAQKSALYFYSFGRQELTKLSKVVSRIGDMGWTVGDLVRSLVDWDTHYRRHLPSAPQETTHNERSFPSSMKGTTDLFDYYFSLECGNESLQKNILLIQEQSLD